LGVLVPEYRVAVAYSSGLLIDPGLEPTEVMAEKVFGTALRTVLVRFGHDGAAAMYVGAVEKVMPSDGCGDSPSPEDVREDIRVDDEMILSMSSFGINWRSVSLRTATTSRRCAFSLCRVLIIFLFRSLMAR